MFKHPHVEDYIEIIAGFREPTGKQNHSIFINDESPVSLARYDMKVVPSLAEQSIGGKGYTDKQAALAVSLIIKYERQLAKLQVDITPVHTPVYRIPLRTIDRTTRVWIENDVIKLRFPYNAVHIEQVRAAAKESRGRIQFNPEQKCHDIDLTEWNLNWTYAFCQQHKFEIDPAIQQLMDVIVATEQTPYAIELQYKNDAIAITNAPDSLIEYITEKAGGITTDNLFRLIDLAPILGYTIARAIEETVIESVGTRFYSLCANRHLKVDPLTSHNLVKEILDYARATDRFPIYVYEPDLSMRLYNEFHKYLPGSIAILGKKSATDTIPADAKIIYTNRIPRKPVGNIPLMISSAGMLFGGDRQIWIQTAEKVVYFTNDVYNKNSKGPAVCKLD